MQKKEKKGNKENMNIATQTAALDDRRLLEQYGWIVRNLARSVARYDESIREDLEQIGYIALLEAARTWDPAVAILSTYAYQAVRGAMRKQAAREMREREGRVEDRAPSSRPDGFASLIDQIPSLKRNAEEQMLADERDIIIGQLLETLSDRDQAVLTMRFYEGLSEKEIAAVLEVHNSTVSRLITSALERLKKKLKARELI